MTQCRKAVTRHKSWPITSIYSINIKYNISKLCIYIYLFIINRTVVIGT